MVLLRFTVRYVCVFEFVLTVLVQGNSHYVHIPLKSISCMFLTQFGSG